MKKLLGIVVLGLLLSGNAKAEILEFDCVPMYKSKTISDVVYFIDTESNEFATEYIYKGEKRRDETFFYLNQTGTSITYSYDANKEYVYQFDYGQNSFIDRQIKPDNGKGRWKCNSRENIKKIEKAEAELMITKAKDTCKSIGFKVDTEKFVDCVKDIYIKQLDTQKVEQQLDQNNTTKKTKRKIDPTVWDDLLKLGGISSGSSSSSSSSLSKPKGTCYNTGEETGGTNKSCKYSCSGNIVTITISSLEVCPLHIQR